jgi:hypothetical protein
MFFPESLMVEVHIPPNENWLFSGGGCGCGGGGGAICGVCKQLLNAFPMIENGTTRLLFIRHSNTSINSIFYSKNQ